MKGMSSCKEWKAVNNHPMTCQHHGGCHHYFTRYANPSQTGDYAATYASRLVGDVKFNAIHKRVSEVLEAAQPCMFSDRGGRLQLTLLLINFLA